MSTPTRKIINLVTITNKAIDALKEDKESVRILEAYLYEQVCQIVLDVKYDN